MSSLDWIVLSFTLTAIIIYGLYKSRTSKNLEGYFLSNRSMPWYIVLLSIMGTQASAITFLSAPGQAFTDGMRFVQYYFGLPIAMIVLCITFVPIFKRLKIFTAYEYLEQRFDVKTRTLTSFLFLLSRGLSTGISIYAPSIILSSLLGWDIFWTNIVMGGLLIIYTVSGGAKAVAYTQQLQLIIIIGGMIVTGYVIMHLLPENIGFIDALKISGRNGKMNVITTGITNKGFNWKDKYNIISGIIGGFFLALSYFGTDQSQVGRYLTAKNETESKVGLLMNGVIKVPMQFLILLLGVLLFTFYQFKQQPVFFNPAVQQKMLNSTMKDSVASLEKSFSLLNEEKQSVLSNYKKDTAVALQQLAVINKKSETVRSNYKNLVKQLKAGDDNDTNYIFLRFVVDYLPKGLVGLLIAIIFLAAWGSIAAALNSLASCTMIDFHKKFRNFKHDDTNEILNKKDYRISKYYTLAWGIFSVIVAEFATGMGSLIEAVNVLGSLFYGVILGIFLVAFYCKKIKSNAVFVAALITEMIVITLFLLDKYEIIGLGFLWLNVIGALLVLGFAWIIQKISFSK
ncbi:MAG: sodium:solute symporter [Bacteroidetes bacterium]|nr:sodium:solute symporter [Bacteroidota bacterium]MBS1641514.1 sodium:solute symporter [Bacteroidota bacterium]MBS1671637.1 sodium:solute symporter [Bacteroidota bacterium]